ncbi:MAG: Uncharacterised protein [Methanobacteriota archaeon]|nr:MAG: Uncharacterised protein [Euryarchaeota archaeon]
MRSTCVAYAAPPVLGKTENVISTSSVAKASRGKETSTSIVPLSSLVNLESVDIVDSSKLTDHPVGGAEEDILKVSGPFPWLDTVNEVVAEPPGSTLYSAVLVRDIDAPCD